MESTMINWIVSGLAIILMFLLQQSYKARASFEKRMRESIENIHEKITDIEKSMIRLEMTIKQERE